MSDYYDETEYTDPLVQAYQENPVAVIQAAATLAAQNAAQEVGQTVWAQQNWQLQVAQAETANAADKALSEQFGVQWEQDKQAFASEFIATHPEYISAEETLDAEALANTLKSGYRLWKTETVENAERLDRMETKEFQDEILRIARDGSYAAKMANADYRAALSDVQGRS